MPRRCVVTGCNNNHYSSESKNKCSIFKFPDQNKRSEIFQKWMAYIHLANPDFTSYETWNNNVGICAEHFAEDQFDPRTENKIKFGLATHRQLLKIAFPSIPHPETFGQFEELPLECVLNVADEDLQEIPGQKTTINQEPGDKTLIIDKVRTIGTQTDHFIDNETWNRFLAFQNAVSNLPGFVPSSQTDVTECITTVPRRKESPEENFRKAPSRLLSTKHHERTERRPETLSGSLSKAAKSKGRCLSSAP